MAINGCAGLFIGSTRVVKVFTLKRRDSPLYSLAELIAHILYIKNGFKGCFVPASKIFTTEGEAFFDYPLLIVFSGLVQRQSGRTHQRQVSMHPGIVTHSPGNLARTV
jgi:hypothetical protein